MTLSVRTALSALALVASVAAALAAPLENTARSSTDEFNNNRGGGKTYWDKQMKERD